MVLREQIMETKSTFYTLSGKKKEIYIIFFFRKPLVNPAFAKRSLDGSGDSEEELRSISKKEMHDRRKDIKIFDSLDKDEIEFHREGRKNLYGQLEVYIQT